MTELIIPRATYGFGVNASLQTHSGDIFNVSGYTVGVRVWAGGTPGTVFHSSAVTVNGAASGSITWTIASGVFMSSDSRYQARFVANISGVREAFEMFTLKVEEGTAN